MSIKASALLIVLLPLQYNGRTKKPPTKSVVIINIKQRHITKVLYYNMRNEKVEKEAAFEIAFFHTVIITTTC